MTVHLTASLSGEGTPPDRGRIEVLLLDHSSSMSVNDRRGGRDKISVARDAARSAMEAIEEGTWFAVVAGNHAATMVYPETRKLARMSAQTRAQAVRAVRDVAAVGGTAIGSWLACARELFGSREATTRHALLLTDGRNEHEPELLQAELAACQGAYVCDPLGVGDDWEGRELLDMGAALGGRTVAVAELDDLSAHLRDLLQSSRARAVQDVVLRVQPYEAATIATLREVKPRDEDLTEQLARTTRYIDLDTGPWALGESKDYFLTLDVDPELDLPIDVDLPLAEIRLVPPAGITVTSPVEAVGRWTLDPDEPDPRTETVRGFHRHIELQAEVEAGYVAYQTGDLAVTAGHWSAALRLAVELGDSAMEAGLRDLLHEDDDGGFRVRPDLTWRQVLAVLVDSHRSSSSSAADGGYSADGPTPMPVGTVCGSCGEQSAGYGPYCEGCGASLAPDDGPS